MQKGYSFESLGRIDWEGPRSDRSTKCATIPDPDKLNAVIEEIKSNDFDAVVIKDLGKGVVSKQVITDLIAAFTESNGAPKWFVSTKSHNPTWLELLRSQDVRLTIIPEIAAADYITRSGKPNWFCVSEEKRRTHHPTDGALAALEELRTSLPEKPEMATICLPSKFQLIARLDDIGVHQGEEEPRNVKFHDDAAMASAFFPKAVCRLLIMRDPKRWKSAVKETTFRKFLTLCLGDTATFNQHEAGWINGARIGTTTEDSSFPADCLVSFSIKEENKQWRMRTKKPTERFKDDAAPKLELWRAMTEVEKYVCLVDERRHVLAKLVQAVRDFGATADRPSRSISGLLTARPGSGKTSLVRGIAAMCDVRPLEFNVTQMLRREELFACFDSIVTAQAQERQKPVFVFFDEVNALLENQHVYDAFLAPLEDGYYLRNGRKFFIHPCIWLFAATPDAMESKAQAKEAEKSQDKKGDFRSRLTLGELNLTSEPKLRSDYTDDQVGEQTSCQKAMKAENVYRAAAILQQMYPDVRNVSVAFLQWVYDQPYRTTAREIRDLMGKLRRVRYGEVSCDNLNLPAKSLKRVSSALDKKYVEIV